MVNRLSADGTIDKMLCVGLMPPKIVFYREVFLLHDINTRLHKMPIMQSQEELADRFHCSVDTIYRAISTMKHIIPQNCAEQ